MAIFSQKRNVRPMLAIGLVSFMLAAPAQATSVNVYQACKLVHTACSYEERYNIIDWIYLKTGQVMFDKAYIGTAEQNAKLARNIVANRHLFNGGWLPIEAIARWRMVK